MTEHGKLHPHFLKRLSLLAALLLSACTPERDPIAADAALARAFHAQNRRADFSEFDGVTVRVSRPVLRNDVTVLGHVYAISFCSEVVDVRGYRATSDLTFTYSDWPPMQHELARRVRRDSIGQQTLAALFQVPPQQARTAFASWAATAVERFKALNPPRALTPTGREVRAVRACVSAEGHPVYIELASGLELFYLPPDTENSLYWTKKRRQYQQLAPQWYWRRRATPEITADNPAGV